MESKTTGEASGLRLFEQHEYKKSSTSNESSAPKKSSATKRLVLKICRVLSIFLRGLRSDRVLRSQNGWLTGMALLILVGCAQDSVPVKRENIVGRWRSERGRLTLSFYADGLLKKQEQADGLRLLTGGFFMLDSDSRWSLSDEKLIASSVVFKIRRFTADTMVIQFGDDPSFRFRRVESDVPGLQKTPSAEMEDISNGIQDKL